MSDGLRVRAYAKVNLGLQIRGLRSDGYHEVCTLLQVIDLSDVMSISFDQRLPPGETRICCHVPGVPAGDRSAENLISRALHFLAPPYGARVHLDKHIPVSAGLGGGSSDAAAMIAAASHQFWGNPPENQVEECELGRSLGVDIPFFLRGGSQLATSRGDHLRSVSFPGDHWVLLLHPPHAMSTGAVYRAYDALSPERREGILPAKCVPSALRDGDLRAVLPRLHNDLEVAAFRLKPELQDARDLFAAAAGREVLMSGSGSAFFTLFRDEERARYVARSLREDSRVRFAGEVYLARFVNDRGWRIIR